MEGIFYLFAFNIIISGIMVVSALNPVYSVFWLIIAFINASILFILLDVDFIALIFLIVYVGAIAILFLFVIMMLNLIDYERGKDMSNYLPAGFVIGVIFFITCRIILLSNQFSTFYVNKFDFIENFSNITGFGRVLYTDYYYLFLIASLILLIAMIGAIVLTHEIKKEKKNQDIFIQISRKFWDF
uniref:NADH-ubiquinone oxidoreductase chain 6 n=1 Tax=Ptilocaulis walpersi TaxID=479640 RepID=I6LIK8_9METZ|nr:NADH dehydrogenase subunit 6 [Ptilocaulis walpersi]ABW83889.1 NADH dehydrogenase subunit 6 [Ptilocaulis walpersi]